MTMKITIEKLSDYQYSDRSQHNRPLRWRVNGPREGEFQDFTTRKEAHHYRQIRHCSDSQMQAIHSYAIGM